MTITLDDVSNLLHLPIFYQFYTHQTLDGNGANDLLVESLRVDHGVATEETGCSCVVELVERDV